MRTHNLSREATEIEQGSGEKASHACIKFSSKKINYLTNTEFMLSLASEFIAINFLNFRHSFMIGKYFLSWSASWAKARRYWPSKPSFSTI